MDWTDCMLDFLKWAENIKNDMNYWNILNRSKTSLWKAYRMRNGSDCPYTSQLLKCCSYMIDKDIFSCNLAYTVLLYLHLMIYYMQKIFTLDITFIVTIISKGRQLWNIRTSITSIFHILPAIWSQGCAVVCAWVMCYELMNIVIGYLARGTNYSRTNWSMEGWDMAYHFWHWKYIFCHWKCPRM
jgi:hypothetical protein